VPIIDFSFLTGLKFDFPYFNPVKTQINVFLTEFPTIANIPDMTQNPKLPEKINPVRLAEKCVTLKGVLAIREMRRLKDLVSDSRGEISIKIDFSYDANHAIVIALEVTTTLVLQCQRCMENFNYPIHINNLLSPVKNDAEAAKMQRYEPLLVEGDFIVLPEVVEDEILLNLPLVAKHTQNTCPVVLSPPDENKIHNPFKMLLSQFKVKKEE
jgi:uncharacterized protein